MEKLIGRILWCTEKQAHVELMDGAIAGMIVSASRKNMKYIGKIDRVESSRLGGLTGYVYWLDELDRPFKTMTKLFEADEETEGGVLMVGNDRRNIGVKLRVNPLFGHVLVAGMTTAGKTHFLIVLCEEFGPHKIPCLVIDPQGEFINLPAVNPDRFVLVEELRMEDLKSYMQQRKVVIYNLLGYTKKSKVSRVAELLTDIMHEKEKDYQQAMGYDNLLELPPFLIMVDEADIFAPNYKKAMNAPREAVQPMVDLLERGSKFGLGAIVATQRITRLELDVRSQCNAAVIYRLIEAGSIQAVRTIDFIPKEEIAQLPALNQGECILAGNIVTRSRRILVRDIITKRAKKRNYEMVLGIETPEQEEVEYVSRFEEDDGGSIVDKITGEVVHEGADRLAEKDKEVFEATEGDGVILRGHITPEEQKILQKLRKPDEKGDRRIG